MKLLTKTLFIKLLNIKNQNLIIKIQKELLTKTLLRLFYSILQKTTLKDVILK